MKYKRLLACVLSGVLLCSGLINKNCYPDNLSELRKKSSQIKQDSAQTNKLINQARQQKNSTQREIDNLDCELINAKKELDQTINRLENTKKKLAQNQIELEQARIKHQNQYDAYKQRIKFIYENGKMAYVKIVFQANSFHDFLKRVDYVNSIIKYDCELLDKSSTAYLLYHPRICRRTSATCGGRSRDE